MTELDDEERTVDEVRRKAARMRRARQEQTSIWLVLGRAGAVGWQLALPLAGGALGGHALARATGVRAFAIAGLLLGLVVGGWGAWRAIRSSLPEDQP